MAAMGDHHLRGVASAFVVLAAAVCVVVVPVMDEGRCCVAAAARPLMRGGGSAEVEEEEEAVMMDVSAVAASPEGARWVGVGRDGVVRAGKWLPLPLPTMPLPAASALAGGLRFPAAGVSMPWMAGAPPALAGPGLQFVPPYVGATRQEQLSLWASLFNPFQVKPRLPSAETTSPGPVDIPAIAGVGQERTTTVEDPAGEPRWGGVFLGNNHNGN
ncbi:hypothetical protein GUJ93_ZPchr0009g2440 [Zizania palustris]|uniref:Uncharacterized protein n=1 Tax=Zizania palustris TaxID=103762 RepID=A0A8J5RLJ0_ZIZPA|nr:hypothetical protein GUJ93_ZPchr0009g2440 [Zizania palustris]